MDRQAKYLGRNKRYLTVLFNFPIFTECFSMFVSSFENLAFEIYFVSKKNSVFNIAVIKDEHLCNSKI